MTKPFDKELYDKHDPFAKRVASEIARDYIGADDFVENENEMQNGYFDGEMLMPSGVKIKVEAEWKDGPNGTYWGEEYVTAESPFPFRFSTIDYAYRKKKCIAEYFLTTNGSYAFMVSAKAVKDEEKVGNKYDRMTKGREKYFMVPIKEGIFLKKTKKGWKRWCCQHNR